jgi:hypothetical protein
MAWPRWNYQPRSRVLWYSAADCKAQRSSRGPATVSQDFIMDARSFIFDPETRRVIALIRNGQVFRDDEEGAKVAYLVGSNLYDLSGNFLGRLNASERALPIGLRTLLQGELSKGARRRRAKRAQDPGVDQDPPHQPRKPASIGATQRVN